MQTLYQNHLKIDIFFFSTKFHYVIELFSFLLGRKSHNLRFGNSYCLDMLEK